MKRIVQYAAARTPCSAHPAWARSALEVLPCDCWLRATIVDLQVATAKNTVWNRSLFSLRDTPELPVRQFQQLLPPTWQAGKSGHFFEERFGQGHSVVARRGSEIVGNISATSCK